MNGAAAPRGRGAGINKPAWLVQQEREEAALENAPSGEVGVASSGGGGGAVWGVSMIILLFYSFCLEVWWSQYIEALEIAISRGYFREKRNKARSAEEVSFT